MTYDHHDITLPLVRQPSQYLGCEINARRKDPGSVALRMLLAFPDLYEIGMSYQGLQILYQILNERPDIGAERVFAPALDMASLLRERGDPLRSLETGTPVGAFSIVGFSLLYELSYTNILAMLELSGIPFLNKDRDESHPLVIAGGPCTFNPEPMADIFDAMVVGDGENLVLRLADVWLAWRERDGDRGALFDQWARLPGVYIPSFFRPRWDAAGNQGVVPRKAGYTGVKKALLSDIDTVPPPYRPIVPFGNPVHDRLSIEVCRGCTRGCRFCQAGMIYRPVRERHPEGLLASTDRALAGSGYEDLSLLSLSTGDYASLPWLIHRLMDRCEPERIALSLPSLRVGGLNAPLMRQIKRVRKTGFTLAPEAGSQRLRDVINKDVDEASLFTAVDHAMALGWQGIKLYFMIGLPTETAEDIDAIIDLAARLARMRPPKKGWKGITVSVSTFVPKPHTPFQWCSQVSLQESREKIAHLKAALRKRGIRFKWQNPEMSLLEGVWARGDRKLTPLLIRAYRNNCRFDGWSDHFNLSAWQDAMAATGIDPQAYLRSREATAPLPWDHIDAGVSKAFLWDEWEKSLALTPTSDCRSGTCHGCGVCDFKEVMPVIYRQTETTPVEVGSRPPTSPVFRKRVLLYSKTGPARFFGHLELVRIIERAFRRARIPVQYSQGFHPSPKISFDTALPVGIESREECLSVETLADLDGDELTGRLNECLPSGLRIRPLSDRAARARGAVSLHKYVITLRDEGFPAERLQAFDQTETWPVQKVNRKGRVSTADLKRLVNRMSSPSPGVLEMVIDGSRTPQLRVTRILEEVFGLTDRAIQLARIQKEPAGGNEER